MILYLAGGHYISKIKALFINSFINNRLFSFAEKENKRGEYEALMTLIYFAGFANNEKRIEKRIEKRLLTYNLIKKIDMKLYFAGGDNKSLLECIEKADGNNSLYSYYYLKKDNGKNINNFISEAHSPQKSIFIDSGGYSAFTKNIDIDIDEYCDWLLLHRDKLKVYAVLDVINNPTLTQKNLNYMEKRGLNPLPIFHYGSNYDILRGYVNKYKYIAIGGMVRRGSKRLIPFLDKCFSIIKNKSKIHGFGATADYLLKRYPFYSVDSTSWLGGSMRAEVYFFKSNRLIIKKTTSKKEANYSTINFSDNRDKRWIQRVIHNAVEFQKYEKYITNLWRERGVIWD